MLKRLTTPALLATLAAAAASCSARPPVAPGLPSKAALVELRLSPPRDVAALTSTRDTVWLRDAAALTGRVVAGDADSLDFVPGELRRGDGVRDANLPRGLTVRLPRDPAGGVALHVLTHDTRQGVVFFTILLTTFALVGIAYLVAISGD